MVGDGVIGIDVEPFGHRLVAEDRPHFIVKDVEAEALRGVDVSSRSGQPHVNPPVPRRSRWSMPRKLIRTHCPALLRAGNDSFLEI